MESFVDGFVSSGAAAVLPAERPDAKRLRRA
jgi:hypothetical protein